MLTLFSQYWFEFLTIAGVHILAVASPGPDFAVVFKHSITYGRRAAMYTSIGIGAGILVHVAYSLLGIGLLIKNTPGVFTVLSYAAAAYLLFIGWGALKSQPPIKNERDKSNNIVVRMSNRRAFGVGLLTNGLNPKATLFFLSIFAVVISADTPTEVKVFYGLYLCVATGLWFCVLSYWLSSPSIRNFLLTKGYWFDRIMGTVLILLAIKLVMTA